MNTVFNNNCIIYPLACSNARNMKNRTFILIFFGLITSFVNSNSQTYSYNENEEIKNINVSDVPPANSFRMIFGLRDIEPSAWDGQVLPAHNQFIELEADRFRNHQYSAKVWRPEGITNIKLGDPPLPNDYLKNKTTWICSTRYSSLHGPTTEWHDYGQIDKLYGNDLLKPVIQYPSILIHIQSNAIDQPVNIKTVRGEFSFIPREIISRRSGYFLEGNIKVESIPSAEQVSEESTGQQDFPSVFYSRSGKVWVAWQEYNDKSDLVLTRSRSGNKWSPISVLAENAAVFHTAVAEDKNNRIWVVWAMQVNDRWDLYGRYFDDKGWSEQECLTQNKANKNFYHQMITDTKGHTWLVWQCISGGYSQICAKYFDGRQWSREEQISSGNSSNGNNWWPSAASGPDGSLVVAWDGYAAGNYDIYLRRWKNNLWEEEVLVAGTDRFEAHPSVVIGNNNRIWIAWDESGINWGKDTGFHIDRKGTQLHESRSISITCFDGNKRLEPADDLHRVLPLNEFWELPHLQVDSGGKPLLFARHMVMREPDTPLEGPIDLALWEIYLTQYNGSNWSEPLCLPYITGRNEMMPGTIPDSDGNILAVWATDLRDRRTFQSHHCKVQYGKIETAQAEGPLSLKDHIPPEKITSPPFDQEEAAQVQKIRSYRIQNSGRTYSIFRGDLHRHSDISADGYNDGSLLDAYRYARDVAAMDFIGVSDHTTNVWDTYNWWRNQKVADLFRNNNSFVAFYGYERSVEYPNGHRNIFFTERGANILPIDPLEERGYEGSGPLYWYLRRNNGFSIPHTTGRTSGTDWRDNDPEVENLLEIYQGMRDSYEYPGSPRPFKLYQLPDSTRPIPRASSAKKSPSFRQLGFAWNALDKGYKLGFIASSDHISTHISYACIIAEKLTPESLLEAIRERRTYASTDNIIMDIKHVGSDGVHLMGEIFDSKTPLCIKANIIGTGEIQQIDIIKNNSIIKTYKPGKITYNFEYIDKELNRGENYFYVRIIQRDGEMAWGSPVWVTYNK